MLTFETWPLQEINLLLSLFAFALFSSTLLMAKKVNGQAPPSVRWGLAGLVLFAALRLYSSSSFAWGQRASELGLLPVLRMGVIVLLTLIVIIGLALAAYYWRRVTAVWRSKRSS